MMRPQVPQIFSKKRRVARAVRHYGLCRTANEADRAEQFLRADMADDILERLAFMKVEPTEVLIHGDWPGYLGIPLMDQGFSVWDTGPDTLDEEQPLEDPIFKIIVNMANLDTVNDLPGALIHIRNALPEGGLFIGSFIGAGSLPILRQVMLAADGDRPAARVHPQIDNEAASALMARAGFARQVVDSRPLKVSYRSFEQLVCDLRAQGLTSVLADAPPSLTRSALRRAQEAFDELADEEGRVTEHFEILTLTGWR